ncbi:MAG TPA: Rieske (2Fe-2S) protein [Caulobacteraceae bacterium]|nr:Rieske (2Fe-2S) protein [Caulobacteraceae bacterium]
MSFNPAQPPAGTVLCRLEAVPDPGSKGFQFRAADQLFLGFIVRREGQIAGYVDCCPHAGMPLALFDDRYLTREGDLILCSSHGALFRPHDGLCIGGPCAGRRLPPWPVRVEGDEIVTA